MSIKPCFSEKMRPDQDMINKF